jgi:hypothetical protein
MIKNTSLPLFSLFLGLKEGTINPTKTFIIDYPPKVFLQYFYDKGTLSLVDRYSSLMIITPCLAAKIVKIFN